MRLTDSGHEELERWFATPIQEDLGRIRSELTAKLVLADAAHAHMVLEHFERHERARIDEAKELICSREPLPDAIGWETALVELLRETALSERIAEMFWLRAAREMLVRLANQELPPRKRQHTGAESGARRDNQLTPMLTELRMQHDKLIGTVK
jgi:hypothetical protein